MAAPSAALFTVELFLHSLRFKAADDLRFFEDEDEDESEDDSAHFRIHPQFKTFCFVAGSTVILGAWPGAFMTA